MPGWSRAGRDMVLGFENGAVRYKWISEQEAKDIGLFVMGLGFLLLSLAVFATTAVMDDGRISGAALGQGTEGTVFFVGLLVWLGIWFAPRGGIALIIVIVAYVAAIDYGRELLEEPSRAAAAWMVGVWALGLLGGFALMWPYPLWPGLVVAYCFSLVTPIALLGAWINPGADAGVVVAAWVAGLCVEFFGMSLRYRHRWQQDLEGSHYVRYGD